MNVKNVIIIMSWVGVKEEILSPQQVLSLLPPEFVLYATERWTHREQAIFLGSYLNCVLHSARISIFNSIVYKLKKDGEFYAGFLLNMSFSIAQWTQCLPGAQKVVLTGLITRKHYVNIWCQRYRVQYLLLYCPLFCPMNFLGSFFLVF